jgi:hypothetical protein
MRLPFAPVDLENCCVMKALPYLLSSTPIVVGFFHWCGFPEAWRDWLEISVVIDSKLEEKVATGDTLR